MTGIISRMEKSKAPEFDPKNPLPSAFALIRAVLLSPRSFYLNFSAEGSIREPALFVWFVSLVTGVLNAVIALISGSVFGQVSTHELVATVIEAAVFIVVSPAAVGVVAAVYLLSIRTFVGKVSNFREVYRMVASAYSAMILAWIPVIKAFAITYFLMVLMALAIRSIYRESTMTAIVTVLVAFVPVAAALAWLSVTAASLAAG